MTKLEILSENAISMAELSAELAKIKKRDKELGFRAAKTEEYLAQFSILDDEKARALLDKLTKLNVPRLRDVHIIKLIDLLPTNPEDVRLILQGYTITVNQDNLKKIAKTIEEAIAK